MEPGRHHRLAATAATWHRLATILTLTAVTGCAEPLDVPGAPTGLAAVPLDGAIAASWTLGSEGSGPLLNHAYSLDDGATWSPFDPAVTEGGAAVTGLTNGDVHLLRVRAINAVGPGAASEAVEAVAAMPAHLLAAHAPAFIQAHGVAATRAGGVLVGGYSYGSASFGETTTPPAPHERGFLVEIDADAAWGWLLELDGAGPVEVAALATQPGTGVAVAANFGATLDLGSIGAYEAASGGVFVGLLDDVGEWSWVTAALAPAATHVEASALAVGPNGDVFVAGHVYGSVDFGPHTTPASAVSDAFVARLGADGTWRWVVTAGANDTTQVTTLAVAADGTLIVGGRTRASHPVATLPEPGNAGNHDGFVTALDPNGEWLWVAVVGGPSNDGVTGVVITADEVVAVGSFFGAATFGPLGTPPQPFVSSTASFILRLGLDGAWRDVSILAASGGAADASVVPRRGGGHYVAVTAFGDIVLDEQALFTAGAGPLVVALDASGAFAGARALHPAPSSSTGWGTTVGATLGGGGVPVIVGRFDGSVTDGATIVTSTGGASDPDAFVWKVGHETSW